MKNFLKFVVMFVILAIVGTFLPTNTVKATTNTDYSDTVSITKSLKQLERFVTHKNGSRLQILNSKAARSAGISNNIVALAEEMVMYQNELILSAKDIRFASVSVDSYPKVKAFMNGATAHAHNPNGTNAVIQAVNSCGDWGTPIPNKNPGWGYSSSSNPVQALRNLGFHNTAGYACGYGNCATSDFTRGRSYSSQYGLCSYPRFRDQGRTEGNAFKIQYGEPNPEVLAYSWPYWNWGAYVAWWHFWGPGK